MRNVSQYWDKVGLVSCVLSLVSVFLGLQLSPLLSRPEQAPSLWGVPQPKPMHGFSSNFQVIFPLRGFRAD